MPGVSFDRAAEYYDATRGYNAGSAERIRDAIVALTGAGPHTRLLELGIGTGRIALPFIRAGYDVTGMDLSQAMMDRLLAAIAGDPGRAGYRLDLRQGDVTALPFADATFAIVLSVHVLHLVADWQAMLREAQRVGRPGGWLLLGHDSAPGDGRPIEGAAVAEPLQVRDKWLALRRAHAADQPAGRSNIWGNHPQVIAYLESLGAQVQERALTTYERPPITPRQMLERLRARMYSSDWETPDAQHGTLVRELDQWFQQNISAPDTPALIGGEFRVLAAQWA
ncbi:MAG: class I SAM-dependent methyltransferase [Kouleothrix sp.]|jgi:ubiquinone/menaquinone biosynthesis C-methylase UbiE|nr:class I SAM-dependent methyltransferase [Kouleothrix sp.]